jgi:hypothetical protein
MQYRDSGGVKIQYKNKQSNKKHMKFVKNSRYYSGVVYDLTMI